MILDKIHGLLLYFLDNKVKIVNNYQLETDHKDWVVHSDIKERLRC